MEVGQRVEERKWLLFDGYTEVKALCRDRGLRLRHPFLTVSFEETLGFTAVGEGSSLSNEFTDPRDGGLACPLGCAGQHGGEGQWRDASACGNENFQSCNCVKMACFGLCRSQSGT